MNESGICCIPIEASQQAHDVKTTSYQRRCCVPAEIVMHLTYKLLDFKNAKIEIHNIY